MRRARWSLLALAVPFALSGSGCGGSEGGSADGPRAVDAASDTGASDAPFPIDASDAPFPVEAGADLVNMDAPGDEASGADGPPAGTCPEEPLGLRAAAWPMPDPTTTGRPGSQSYDSSAADVVVDNVTHLMWQKLVDSGSFGWTDARNHCACLDLAGHGDWRLPTRIELVSLVDFTKHAPAIDGTAFPNTPSEWFWTASPISDDPSFAWYVFFETGYTNFNPVDSLYRVRCVRTATPPSQPASRYQVGTDGTVLDHQTGLTWQQATDGMTRVWADAKAYCASLSLAGGGWHLPNMKELESLVDETRASPSIDPSAFPGTPTDPLWSGTQVAGTTVSAWRVSFEHGYTYDALMTYQYLARCVR